MRPMFLFLSRVLPVFRISVGIHVRITSGIQFFNIVRTCLNHINHCVQISPVIVCQSLQSRFVGRDQGDRARPERLFAVTYCFPLNFSFNRHTSHLYVIMLLIKIIYTLYLKTFDIVLFHSILFRNVMALLFPINTYIFCFRYVLFNPFSNPLFPMVFY